MSDTLHSAKRHTISHCHFFIFCLAKDTYVPWFQLMLYSGIFGKCDIFDDECVCHKPSHWNIVNQFYFCKFEFDALREGRKKRLRRN